MDFINMMVVTPSGLWPSIINAFESFLLNYALAIILLTIAIRIVLIPLDFYRQKSTRDNMRMQNKIGPQLASLQKQYGHDRNLLNQKTMELYKANNFNVMGMCLPMLLYMGLTLFIFISLFGALNSMSAYKLEEQYLTLKNQYEIVYEQNGGDADQINAKTKAEEAVLLKYDEIKNSFLWINNVWVPDTPWNKEILSFKSYISAVGGNVKLDAEGESVKFSDLTEEQKAAYQADYEKVMNVLFQERDGANGYLLTAILAMAITFLAQYLSQRRVVAKNPSAQKTNKVMLIIMPVIMGIFTLFYNAVFGLYLVASQVVAIFTTPIMDKILDKMYAKKDKEEQEKNKVSYSRR